MNQNWLLRRAAQLYQQEAFCPYPHIVFPFLSPQRQGLHILMGPCEDLQRRARLSEVLSQNSS